MVFRLYKDESSLKNFFTIIYYTVIQNIYAIRQ